MRSAFCSPRDHVPSRRKARRLRTLAGLVVLLVLMVAAPSALAHGDDGEMRVQAVRPAGPLRVYVETGVLYTDNDLATEADVTATLTGPEGATVGPVPLPRISGARYGTEVELPAPGTWTVTFTSTKPNATATSSVTVPELAAPTTTSEVPDTTTTTTAPDDGGGSDSAVIATLVVGLIAAAGLAIAMSPRRRT